MYSELANLKWCTPFSKTEFFFSLRNPPPLPYTHRQTLFLTSQMKCLRLGRVELFFCTPPTPSPLFLKFFFRKKEVREKKKKDSLKQFCHRILNVYFIQAENGMVFFFFVFFYIFIICFSLRIIDNHLKAGSIYVGFCISLSLFFMYGYNFESCCYFLHFTFQLHEFSSNPQVEVLLYRLIFFFYFSEGSLMFFSCNHMSK